MSKGGGSSGGSSSGSSSGAAITVAKSNSAPVYDAPVNALSSADVSARESAGLRNTNILQDISNRGITNRETASNANNLNTYFQKKAIDEQFNSRANASGGSGSNTFSASTGTNNNPQTQFQRQLDIMQLANANARTQADRDNYNKETLLNNQNRASRDIALLNNQFAQQGALIDANARRDVAAIGAQGQIFGSLFGALGGATAGSQNYRYWG